LQLPQLQFTTPEIIILISRFFQLLRAFWQGEEEQKRRFNNAWLVMLPWLQLNLPDYRRVRALVRLFAERSPSCGSADCTECLSAESIAVDFTICAGVLRCMHVWSCDKRSKLSQSYLCLKAMRLEYARHKHGLLFICNNVHVPKQHAQRALARG
jgi:hypothetical protein